MHVRATERVPSPSWVVAAPSQIEKVKEQDVQTSARKVQRRASIQDCNGQVCAWTRVRMQLHCCVVQEKCVSVSVRTGLPWLPERNLQEQSQSGDQGYIKECLDRTYFSVDSLKTTRVQTRRKEHNRCTRTSVLCAPGEDLLPVRFLTSLRLRQF